MAANKIKEGNNKLTLSIEEKILRSYKEHCKKKGLIISKQIENFMKEKLKDDSH